MAKKKIKELTPSQLRRTFDSKKLGIKTTKGLKPLEGIIGQRRALSALKFGLGIEKKGFNVYVAGPPGIGKMTAVKTFLEKEAGDGKSPSDWCYVNNFDDTYQPTTCRLPAGMGKQFQEDMDDLIEHFRQEIPKAFEGEDYGNKRERIIKDFEKKRSQVQEEITNKAKEANFNIEVTPQGIMIVPLLGGRPLSDTELAELPEDARQDVQKRREQVEKELKNAMKRIRVLQKQTQERLQKLDKQVTLFVVGDQIDDLIEKYDDYEDVIEYLQSVKSDIQENINTFRGNQSSEEQQTIPGMGTPWAQKLPFRKYQVNVVVDNGKLKGAPVVIELNPNYSNLFGRIEKETQFGALYTDFLMIKSGALHHANGGYLVLPVEDLLMNPLSWQSLKRAIQNEEIQIEEPSHLLGLQVVKSLRPQPTPLDVKIILIGRPMLYYLLHHHDEEFPELFKVKADFDTRMESSDDNIQDFVSFLCKLHEKEDLKDLDGSAIAAVLEHSLRLSEDREKISTQFGALADVVREANFWAKQAGSVTIKREHVHKALDEKVYRSNLIKERINEMIDRGVLLIGTDGEMVGQVNGLAVSMLGDYEFGRSSRITATVGPGRGGIIDIEREIKLGGPIHTKGVMILSGYLAGTFATDYPLSLSARLVFEQSYEGIDGDSASSTELYALLSALAQVPIKQGIAVTGSVNQNGEVQAIGGVNVKIEGFFEVCKTKGLTGEQGVMIPQSNVQNLMLREDVVKAVKDRKFHIWPIRTIDEGIEMLTGVPAGRRGQNGKYPKDSINYLVDQRLRSFAEAVRPHRDDSKQKS
jgi:lon-related putative ATP-dependent protease